MKILYIEMISHFNIAEIICDTIAEGRPKYAALGLPSVPLNTFRRDCINCNGPLSHLMEINLQVSSILRDCWA